MLLPASLEVSLDLLGQGPLSALAIVSAILSNFLFEVFVRGSTKRQVPEHASFIVAAAHIAIHLVELRARDGSSAWCHIASSSIFDHIVGRNRRRAAHWDGAHLSPGQGPETGCLSPPSSEEEVNIMCHYIRQEV